MEGSKTCNEVGDSVGVVNQLKTIENSEGHVSYMVNEADRIENINYSAAFIADIACSDVSTSTYDVSDKLASIQVFPNPTSSNLTLSIENTDDLYLEFYTILGRKLRSYSNKSTLSLDQFSNGIYFLKITDLASSTSKTIKVVIEK
jgi:hypothetical protein